jgi:hypothetical protein
MIPSFHLVSEALMSALAARAEDWIEWCLIELSAIDADFDVNLKDLPTNLSLNGVALALGVKTANAEQKWISLPGDFESPSLAVSSILGGDTKNSKNDLWGQLNQDQMQFKVKIKNSKGFFTQDVIKHGDDVVSLANKI